MRQEHFTPMHVCRGFEGEAKACASGTLDTVPRAPLGRCESGIRLDRRRVLQCQCGARRSTGSNALIGRQLQTIPDTELGQNVGRARRVRLELLA